MNYGSIGQAKPETVTKVVEIVRKQLALPDDRAVVGESKFATLGADSLDTVKDWNHMGLFNWILSKYIRIDELSYAIE